MDNILQNINPAIGYDGTILARSVTAPANKDGQKKFESTALRFGETQFAVPVRLALSSDPDHPFTLPLDPIVSINGSNAIVKREIAKSQIRGTVKELWTQSDWQISLSGVLASDSEYSVEEYIQKLYELVTADEALIIECDTLNNVFDVTRVCVESYDFPFTKGIDYQSFSIGFVSDESYQLDLED